ncbi:MAG: hypothetical protein ACKV1O_28815 [Saprospiraceae bacterium]
MKKTNLIFGLVVLLGAVSCNRPPAHGSVSKSAENPAPSFSWQEALDKQVWVNFALAGYDQDTLVAKTLYTLWKEKSRTASRFRNELKYYALPDSSIFYEFVDFGATGVRNNRALALWIGQPQISFVEEGAKGCEVELSGLGEILGTKALLLLDTDRKHILQRLDSIPGHQIEGGFYAPFASPNLEKVNALHLLDIDGDGIAAELLFYYYSVCNVYDCAIVAYDQEVDRLVQRAFRLNVTSPVWDENGLTSRDTSYFGETKWVLDFPLNAVGPAGQIKYVKDVGHASDVIHHYDFKFNRNSGCFEGALAMKRIEE